MVTIEQYMAQLARLAQTVHADGNTKGIVEDVASLSADDARAMVLVAAGLLGRVTPDE